MLQAAKQFSKQVNGRQCSFRYLLAWGEWISTHIHAYLMDGKCTIKKVARAFPFNVGVRKLESD